MSDFSKRSLDLSNFFLIKQILFPQLIFRLIRCIAEKVKLWENRALKVKWKKD